MATRAPTKEQLKLANKYLDEIERAVRDGYLLDERQRENKREPTAYRMAADRLKIPTGSRHSFLGQALRWTGRSIEGIEKAQRSGDRNNTPSEKRPPAGTLDERVLAALRKERKGIHIPSLAGMLAITDRDVVATAKALQAKGYNIILDKRRGHVALAMDLKPAFSMEDGHIILRSDANNRFLFGAVGDNHLGSRYERLDALNDLYDRMHDAGVQHVMNTGNWIDGEARFNRHELHVHGMDAQLAYLVRNYPKREGITTYAVTGDDHEGWYAQREGIDIGVRAEQDMRAADRWDWVNLGYQEAHVILENANTGKRAVLAVVHPGGGSAYALSYSIQKVIESLDGGEKPGVALYGHYHKLHGPMNIRNVFAMQTGCTQDQSLFMRKRRLEAHVGGIPTIKLEQDPATGAIVGCEAQVVRYFVKGYYNERFAAPGRGVTQARRGVA
jgi:hypothetical protein